MPSTRILIVVDGIFNLTTTYPAPFSDASYGPDVWFTVSHLIATLRNAGFTVDTASRGFNAAGLFDNEEIVNTVWDTSATLKGPDPANPTPFLFDDPSVDLQSYDELWLFGFEGYDGGTFAVGPATGDAINPGEPGGLTDSELQAITAFMQQGGGIFATGDHSGLGAALGGRIPRVRCMRKWYEDGDTSATRPPLAISNWPGGSSTRVDTLRKSLTDPNGNPQNFFFDDQSDDIPQPLNLLVPNHPAVQGATGPLAVYPDHMHEGEVLAPSGAMLTQTEANDPSLSFTSAGFVEFPNIANYQAKPIILAQVTAGNPGPGGTLVGHATTIGEGMACENKNFVSDSSVSEVKTVNAIAAYDGATVNVGRIVTDSSFHHFIDLNLLGDPCSDVPAKQQGFNASASGKAVLAELEAYYVNLATWLAWTRTIYFVFGKNNYGRDEVQDSKNYPHAFYIFLEGYTPNVLGSAKPTFSGSFNATNIPGLQITGPAITYAVGNSGANANVVQRIRFEYGVSFTAASLSSAAFPAAGVAPNAFSLVPSIDILGRTGAAAEFFLLGDGDPYFVNINDSADNQFYLSQDLRVFTIAPTANNQTPIGNVPFIFASGSPTALDVAAGYRYIQKLILWLNENIGYKNTGYSPPDTDSSDPLDSILPQQNGAFSGDSSVIPFTGNNVNYNFAIARVRLKAAAGSSAANVKVFFRAFTTQTFDTDYINSAAAVTSADPQITFPSTGSLNDPQSPLPGTLSNAINGCSLPFFATANFIDTPTDFAGDDVNNHSIIIPSGQDDCWAFYGCFLNVNDPSNVYGGEPVQHWFAGSSHNCLVAQIAFQDAPIENGNGVVANPEISDKLAQRNMQVATSNNPGFPATHLMLQTIDLRPSPPPQSIENFAILGYPDEIMVDWGGVPAGTVARLYWPAVQVSVVLALAARLYPQTGFSAADAHTLQWQVSDAITYIPVPFGSPGNGNGFAGLLTVQLPDGVVYGNEFDVLLRRITSRQAVKRDAVAGVREASVQREQAVEFAWRYVTGSFAMKIQVKKPELTLPWDENLLAILKWRLGLIGPGNRWYPILLRYIGDVIGRIDGAGGNAGLIPASPKGYQPTKAGYDPNEGAGHGITGKISGIRYDRFGDFSGFTLLDEHGHEHGFRGREIEVERLIRESWEARFVVTILVALHDPDWPASILLRRPA